MEMADIGCERAVGGLISARIGLYRVDMDQERAVYASLGVGGAGISSLSQPIPYRLRKG